MAIFQLKFASCFDQLRFSILSPQESKGRLKLPGQALTLINEGNLSFIIIYEEERRRNFLKIDRSLNFSSEISPHKKYKRTASDSGLGLWMRKGYGKAINLA